MSRRQRVGVLPLMILSVMLSGVTAIAAHHQKGGRDATRLVVVSSATGLNGVGDRHYFVRREKEAASRYQRRHVLQLRRVAEAKVRAAHRQELRASRPSKVRSSTSAPVPSGWQAWAASSGVVALRNCENGGSYTTRSSNGYFGAYQFDAQTWYANGGVGDPAYASPAEQDQVAYRLYLSRGSAPWPNCGRYL